MHITRDVDQRSNVLEMRIVQKVQSASMYEESQNVKTFAKTGYVVPMLYVKLSITLVNAYVDQDTTEILWTVELVVDHYPCPVDYRPNVQLTHTVIIKFANPLVTTIWNAALMRSAIAVSV